VKNSLFVIFVWLSASCATKVVNSDNFDIAPDKPVTFLIQPTYNYDSLSAENQQLDNQLQEIIANGLIKKGLIVAATPDLYVTYLVNVYPTSEMRNESTYPYCGDDFMYPNYYSAAEYEEGVLIIDLKNHAGVLVWQGTKPFNLNSIQEVQDMLPNICRKIIKTYNYNI
jgi:hypothetical protein